MRAGFAARGVTYALIGLLAAALAAGAGTFGVAPNQEGALALIAETALGKLLLVLIAAGLAAYALWKLVRAGRGTGRRYAPLSAVERLGELAGGAVYVAFAAVAVRALTAAHPRSVSASSTTQPHAAAAGVLGWTAGPALVALAGVTLIVISTVQAVDAIRGGFRQTSDTAQMSLRTRAVFTWLGRIGLSARALVFVLVGWFVVRTALDYDPRRAVGLDGALARLHHSPAGPWLTGLVAAGLLIFAAFSLLEARYREL